MLRGNSPAKIDEKGRLKIPTIFRKYIEDQYGNDLFITSTSGKFVRIYPMPVWLKIEKKIAEKPSLSPAVTRFLDWINYYGSLATFDLQGRVLIQPLLRRSADVKGEVAVLGNQDHLDVWNRERIEAKLTAHPITEEDLKDISALLT